MAGRNNRRIAPHRGRPATDLRAPLKGERGLFLGAKEGR